MTSTVLLDTQVFLWMHAAPDRLSSSAQSMLADSSQRVLLSAVSSWEIAIKHALGRLDLPEPPAEYVLSRIASSRLTAIAIEHSHALFAGALPLHHRDPFDRLLIGQAGELGIPVMTSDQVFDQYDVGVIWADRQ
ncbi:MAG: type II toxin-antitoxin system VapC family toxin [bacterium]|nr:type II toxin-antitoxin system VapC family toxin [bacterium]MCY3891566.1 type II toxin-antitoxin system VapC family toxin [bacterium]MCY3961684.1 type II toxin-antitoxin system VapC family toxin [bacterium]MCY4135122.1 type II toxin-antitoxin system VapC family toxin [bacterium]